MEPEDLEECPECGGNGLVWVDGEYFVDEVCEVCDGTGMVLADDFY